MKIRPELRIGDIVKLSKNGKKCSRNFPLNSTMVVSEIKGDGVDKSSIIVCRIRIEKEFKHHKFYRSELWLTGKNAFSR